MLGIVAFLKLFFLLQYVFFSLLLSSSTWTSRVFMSDYTWKLIVLLSQCTWKLKVFLSVNTWKPRVLVSLNACKLKVIFYSWKLRALLSVCTWKPRVLLCECLEAIRLSVFLLMEAKVLLSVKALSKVLLSINSVHCSVLSSQEFFFC